MGGEFHLPEPIIQRIQSFLTGKQAAQATVLSKSWRRAWLTLPNLDFDDTEYPRRLFYHKIDEFWEFAKKTMQRYEESNLKIESFRLCMERVWYDHSGLANELIVRALKIGATHLSVQLKPNYRDIVLPHEVFESENLVGLSVEACKIDLGLDRNVICSRLESLSLSSMDIGRDMFSKIISSCPLIKNLSLSYVYEEFEEQGVRPADDGLINLHKLMCLVLCEVGFDKLFFGDLSSKFPSLKDFTVQLCGAREEREEIRISSRSLERLNFTADHGRSRVEFDVPSIRKFTFQGRDFHSLSFKSTSRECESHVSIRHYDDLTILWFRKLNKFLTELSRSKIHLSLHVHSNKSFDYEVEDIQGLTKPQVENLTLDIQRLPSLSCSALFDALFRLCRPKFITQYLLPESSFRWKTNNDFLRKTLVRGLNGKCSIRSHFMYGLNDLKEVNVQLFDEVAALWRTSAQI